MADNDFVKKKVVEFNKISTTSSFKTNLTLFSRNWTNLYTYLGTLLSYLKYIDGILDIDTFMATVISTFQSSKAMLTIFSAYVIGELNLQTTNSIQYSITRLDANTIEILNTKNADWVVDKLIVDVKTVDGIKVYPVITTINSKISIYFADGILSDYVILFV